jgi:hypothetical protein
MDLRLIVRLALVLAVGALVAWLAALFLTVSAGSVTAVVVLRTMLVGVILVLLTRLVMRGAYDVPGVQARVALAAVLGFAVFPATWAGRSLLGQLMVDPGPLSVLIDLVVWVAVVVGASRTVELQADRSAPAPYQVR